MKLHNRLDPITRTYRAAYFAFGFYFGDVADVIPTTIVKIPIPFLKSDHIIAYFHNFKGWRIF